MARKKKGLAAPDASPSEGEPAGPLASPAVSGGKGERRATGRGCRSVNGSRNRTQSPKQIAAEAKMRENQREALEYRKQGYTYSEIAEAMNVSTATACRWVKSALAEIPKEAAEDVLEMMLGRLDAMLQKVTASFMEAEGAAAYADMEMILKLEERRAKLLGIGGYAPQKRGEADEVYKSIGETMLKHMEADRPVLRIEPGTELPASPIL